MRRLLLLAVAPLLLGGCLRWTGSGYIDDGIPTVPFDPPSYGGLVFGPEFWVSPAGNVCSTRYQLMPGDCNDSRPPEVGEPPVPEGL